MVVVPKVRNVGYVNRRRYTSNKYVGLSIRLPEEVHDWIVAEAKRIGTSKSDIACRYVIQAYQKAIPTDTDTDTDTK